MRGLPAAALVALCAAALSCGSSDTSKAQAGASGAGAGAAASTGAGGSSSSTGTAGGGASSFWGGILDPKRAADWSSAGVPGGIPDRQTICATLDPGASAAEINDAIAACPPGQVVFLNAGTYDLSDGVDFGNHGDVTLRGAGPDQTNLVFSASVNCSGMGGDICVRNEDISWAGGPTHTANWTAGYAQGTTTITLDDTSALKVGSVLILDQANDSDTDTKSIWVCSTAGVCASEGTGGAGRPGREQEQMVEVTAIDGSTVTISPGLYMPSWRASQSPGAWWADTTIRGVGIESLSVDHSNSDDISGIFFFNAAASWVKDVKSVNANRNHVWMYQSIHLEIRDSYFYGTQNAASQSYGVESYMGSDNLVENDIFEHVTAPLMAGGASSGTVFAYSYMIDMYYTPSPGWMIGSNVAHAAAIDMVLHEGNDGTSFEQDDVHGTHHFLTAFRNHLTGLEPGKFAQTVPVNIFAFGRFSNVVGNVLGTPGYHDTYEWSVSGNNHDTAIYALGADDGAPTDDLVKTTLLRWGNYDTVSDAASWAAGEVPTGLADYPNAVPASQTLPASFYRSTKPGWWPAAIPWPPIGPDVTGGDDASGHAFKIPAHVCYDKTPKDGGGILQFGATKCD